MTDTKSPGLLERSIDNGSAMIRTLLPAKVLPVFKTGTGDIVTALAVASASVLLVSAATDAPPLASLGAMSLLVAIILTAASILRHNTLAACAVGLGWAVLLGQLIAFGIGAVAPALSPVVAILLPAMPPALFALAHLGPVKGAVAALLALSPLVLLSVAPETPPATRNWTDLPPAEQVFARQHSLLLDQISNIRPSQPEKTEVFILAAAGYPYERVFRREVVAAGDIMAGLWDAEGRVIRLGNSADTPLTFPLLTPANLTTALTGLQRQMGAEDILLLFMTSHGQENRFSTQFDPYIPHDLAPMDIDSALRTSGTGAAIIIVSACHSGSFIDELTAPNRLILTAAASDRTSYGCDDQNEWTGWGRAFFTEALPETVDPRAAANLTQAIAASEEQTLELTPSLPQIAEGADIGEYIDRWLSDLP